MLRNSGVPRGAMGHTIDVPSGVLEPKGVASKRRAGQDTPDAEEAPPKGEAGEMVGGTVEGTTDILDSGTICACFCLTGARRLKNTMEAASHLKLCYVILRNTQPTLQFISLLWTHNKPLWVSGHLSGQVLYPPTL